MTIPPSSPMPGSPPKSKKTMFLLLGGVGAVFVVLLCICSGIGAFWYFHSPSIVGKWKDTDGSIMEFKSDGTMTVSNGNTSIQTTYKTDGNKLTITGLMGTNDTETGEYAISGSELTLTMHDGNTTITKKLTRV